MKNNLKKIVSNLLLLSFTVSSIIACSNDSNTSSGASTPSLTASGKSASSNSSYDGVWANVIGLDSRHELSKVALIPANNSHFDLIFMGCTGNKTVSAVNPESMNIMAGYQFPTTKNYNPVWQDTFSKYGYGPIQPDENKPAVGVEEHSLQFDHPDIGQPDSPNAGSAQCFYRIENAELGKPMYIKLANNWKYYCSARTMCQAGEFFTEVPTGIRKGRVVTDWLAGAGVGLIPGSIVTALILHSGRRTIYSLDGDPMFIEFAGWTSIAAPIAFFGIPLGMEAIFVASQRQDGIGMYDTTVNALQVAEVTQEDANGWNQNHDQNHQIAANTTEITPLVDATYGPWTAVHQAVQIVSTDPNVDKQAGLTISIGALTSAILRTGTKDPKLDPFWGCTGKSSCSGNSTNQFNAALFIQIEDNQISEIHDDDIKNSQKLGKDNNVKALSEAEPLAAPGYQLISGEKLSGSEIRALRSRLGNKLANNDTQNIDSVLLNFNQPVSLEIKSPDAPALGGAQESISMSNLKGYALSAILGMNQDDIPLQSGSKTSNPRDYQESIPVIKSVKYYYDKADKASASQDSNSLLFQNVFNCPLTSRPGSNCRLDLKLIGKNDGKKHTGTLMIATQVSKTLYLPVYINYNLIGKTNQIEIDAGDAHPHGVSFKNVSGKTYQQLGMNGLPQGATVSYEPSGCNTNLASGSECMINFNLKNVNVDGDTEDFLMNIYGIDAGNVGKPFEAIPDMDRLPLKITINNSDWAAAKGKKAASVGR